MTFQITTEVNRFMKENYDCCSKCGKGFGMNEEVVFGYSKKDEMLNVGKCCSKHLVKKYLKRYYQERLYKVPQKNVVLWKFMDFSKFVSLLKTKSLFFTRADKFTDPFEGAKGLLKNKKEWDDSQITFFMGFLENIETSRNMNKSQKIEEAKKILHQLESGGLEKRKSTIVSCWHENMFESEAMWKLYAPLDNGIAIRTTYKDLYESLGANPRIDIGKINYVDFNETFTNLNEPFWYKRKSFIHENEVRAVIQHEYEIDGFGKLIPTDLDKLIDMIYVAPTAPKWFFEIVKDVLDKYNLDKPISESALNDNPFF